MAKDKEKPEMTWHRHHKRRGATRLVLGVFLLLIGLSWLGNDMGLWHLNIPWAPLALVLFSIHMMLSGFWRLKEK
ncbi:Uncharacterised protein [uncultured archaeon]|nr:Uncharacterised protein [uncultured archaeon]